MQEIIKKIRGHVQFSQQELADILSVSFATMNRWENGHAMPNKIAQNKLYEFCVQREIPLIDFITEKIHTAAAQVALSEGEILLYHGSKAGLSGAIAPISRERCDFGQGFYMGTQPEQPLTLICDFERSKFYLMVISLAGLKTLVVKPDIEWAMLVAYYRGKMESIQGTPFYDKYCTLTQNCDLVVGSIANDRMFYVLDNFFLGNITDAALVQSLSALQLGQQYVAITKRACDAVRVAAELPLSHLERKCLQEISAANRAKGISLANDICKNYRREGHFFDEILAEAGSEV